MSFHNRLHRFLYLYYIYAREGLERFCQLIVIGGVDNSRTIGCTHAVIKQVITVPDNTIIQTPSSAIVR